MMGSAQLDMLALEQSEDASVSGAGAPSALKLQVAERLAAHRRRKMSQPDASRGEGVATAAPRARKSSVAATVAERYAQTPSYRAFLAEQAQRAIEQAAAAADIAVRNTRAVADAQQNLLDELELWVAPHEFTPETAQTVTSAEMHGSSAVAKASSVRPRVRVPLPEDRPAGAAVRQHSTAGLTVRLYEDAGRTQRALPPKEEHAPRRTAAEFDEALALDDEIAFRQAPVFEEYARSTEPAIPLPANLLEFPRQLIATRKARPRLAEGPLLEEGAPRSPQLRIFEVEAEQFTAEPLAPEHPPERSFIFLDAQPATLRADQNAAAEALQPSLFAPQTAPVRQRLIALAVDGLLVGAATCAFAEVVAKIAGSLPTGAPAVITVAAILTVFWTIYQLLFFTLSDHTPGMRCARIGFCTMADENPSRSAMRRRVLAQAVAILPLGIGVLWALLDDDRLGWHDRISRMYQRAY